MSFIPAKNLLTAASRHATGTVIAIVAERAINAKTHTPKIANHTPSLYGGANIRTVP